MVTDTDTDTVTILLWKESKSNIADKEISSLETETISYFDRCWVGHESPQLMNYLFCHLLRFNRLKAKNHPSIYLFIIQNDPHKSHAKQFIIVTFSFDPKH